MIPLISVLFVLICILLVGVILLQKGRGGGLSGAFGGAGGHTAFGSRTGDMFTWVTVALVAMFLLLGVTAVRVFRPGTPTPVAADQIVPAADTQPAEMPETAPAEMPIMEIPAIEVPAVEVPAVEVPAEPATQE
jgi:preprotein translocase subunit SecG